MGFWAHSSFYSGGRVRQNCRNCNLRSLGRPWENKCLKLCTMFETYLDFEPKKQDFFSSKLFQESQNCHPCVQRNFLRKMIPFSRGIYVFCMSFGAAAIFFVPWQKCYLGEPKQQCTCLEETIVGTLLWKTFFFQLFGLWAEKLGLFMEK